MGRTKGGLSTCVVTSIKDIIKAVTERGHEQQSVIPRPSPLTQDVKVGLRRRLVEDKNVAAEDHSLNLCHASRC